MQDTVKLFVTGIITIGVITALFMPGRQTVQGIQAVASGSQGLLNTAIKG